MNLLKDLLKLNESHNVQEVAKDAVYQADKWMGDDPDDQSEFFGADDESQKEMIDDRIDEYFNRYMNMKSDGAWVSANRKVIVDEVWKMIAG